MFLLCIFIFREVDKGSLIDLLLDVAGYTYGPLLALFTFGILTKRNVNQAMLPLVCIVAPIVCFLLKKNQASLLGSYQIGVELLLINAGLAFLLLYLFSNKNSRANSTTAN